MNPPSDPPSPLGAADSAETSEGPLEGRELEALEQQISAALRDEAALAAEKLESGQLKSGADGEAPENVEGTVDQDAFLDSLRRTWRVEDQGALNPAPETSTDSATGRTAFLSRSDAAVTDPPLGWIARYGGSVAAAAVILSGAIGLYRLAGNTATPPGDSLRGPAAEYALYLSSKTESTTVPGILPETVDFSEGVPTQGTFRIEIHDVAREARIDEVAGATFQAVTYEPRWTCPEAERAKLPDVFWLEVYRSVDPPGSSVVWKKLFARQ